jgi:uncharacterized protein YdhG (YjbR/CyaY superfamily)
VSSERASYFPAIEKKYGQPMAYWFAVMKDIEDLKYPEQAAYLAENYGFSRAHSNALIMYSRGSTSSRRFTTLAQYLKTVTPAQKKTITEIFAIITAKYPKVEVVIAWNKPMAKLGDNYLFGVAALAKYLMLSSWSPTALEDFADRLEPYVVLKKTFRVPSDWQVDKKLILDMVAARIKETKN